MTKATTAEGDQMKYGPNWAFSRRAILKVYEDRFVCRDWTIPYDEIQDATLYSIRSSFFIPGYVLHVRTADRNYHFGLNGNSFWKGELPFAVSREKGKLGYSTISLVVRLAALALLIYAIWSRRGG